MNDLLGAEWRRLRGLAASVGLLHLLFLLLIGRFSNPHQEPYFVTLGFLVGAVLAGIALGWYQLGSYRKPSQWLWLLHRPLAPARIFAALALAALAALATALLLPMLLWTLATDLFSQRVIDSHHYLNVLYLLAYAQMAWLASAYAVLSRHKAALAVLALPLALAVHLISVWWLLLPVASCLLWLGYLALSAFRADREAPIRGHGALLLHALPLQLGLFLLLFQIGQFVFVSIGIMLGTDPLNSEYPPAGGLVEITRAEPADELRLGLAASGDPRAALWSEQLPLLEPVRVGPYLQRYAIRHQFGNLNVPTQWFDPQRGILWSFSHDRMLFLGHDRRSGASRGSWGQHGAGDATAFTEVPFAGPDDLLLTRQQLYAIDHELQRQHPLLQLPAGEWFTDVPRRAFNRLLVLTNQRLLAYRNDRQASDPHAPLLLDWQLPLPRGVDHLQAASIVELMDGWLVSLVYGDGHRQLGFSLFRRVEQPWQQVLQVDPDGRVMTLAERPIARDYPPWVQLSWWISPLLQVFSEWPDSALDKGLSWPLELDPLPAAPTLYPLAGLLALLSTLAAALWLRGQNISRGRRRFWLLSCALLGLPALLSLPLLEPLRRPLASRR